VAARPVPAARLETGARRDPPVDARRQADAISRPTCAKSSWASHAARMAKSSSARISEREAPLRNTPPGRRSAAQARSDGRARRRAAARRLPLTFAGQQQSGRPSANRSTFPAPNNTYYGPGVVTSRAAEAHDGLPVLALDDDRGTGSQVSGEIRVGAQSRTRKNLWGILARQPGRTRNGTATGRSRQGFKTASPCHPGRGGRGCASRGCTRAHQPRRRLGDAVAHPSTPTVLPSTHPPR